MKKLSALILILILAFSLCGCSLLVSKKIESKPLTPQNIVEDKKWLQSGKSLSDVEKRFGQVNFDFEAANGNCYVGTNGWKYIFDFSNNICVEYAIPLKVVYPGLAELADDSGVIRYGKIKEFFNCNLTVSTQADGIIILETEKTDDVFEASKSGDIQAEQLLWYETDYASATSSVQAAEQKTQNYTQAPQKSKADYYLERIERLENKYAHAYDNLITQHDLNQTAYAEYTDWDNLLNDIYSYLKSTKSAGEFASIKNEELQWVYEKEAAMERESKEFEGGSMEALIKYSVGAEYTKERCYDLVSYLY